MLKKVLSFALVMVLVLAVLTGCGPKRDQAAQQASGDKPKKLVVWENADGNVITHTKKLAVDYEKKTGIKVEVVPVSILKQQEKLTLDGPAGKGPDLVTWPHDRIGEAVVKGLIQPVQVDPSIVSQYDDTAINALTYNGKLYGLPYVTESIALIYNKKLMPNPPATWEELYNFAKANSHPAEKKYGLLFEGTNLYFSHFLIAGNGGYIFKNENGKLKPDDIGLDNPGATKAYAEIQKWYNEKLLPQGVNGDVLSGLFKEGKVAAVLNGPWAVKDYQAAGIDVGVVPIPKLNGTDAQTLIGVKGFYLSAYSKNAKYSTELMQFLTNKDSLKSRYQAVEEIPPVKELLADPVIKDNPIVNGFAQQASKGTPMPSIPEMSQVWDPINNGLTFIAQGKQTPEKAGADAVKMIKDKIKTQKQ